MSLAELCNKFEAFVKQLFNAETARLRTNTLCQIVSYDADRNLASVQPCIMGIRTDDTESPNKQLPEVGDIPVFQFGSGLGFCTAAPAAGSYGIYLVMDRGIANWILQGGIVPPSGPQRFDLSDGILLHGIFPDIVDGNNGKLPTAIATDRIELRTRTGDTTVSVKHDETIEIKNANATMVIDTSGNVTVTAPKFILNDETDSAALSSEVNTQLQQLRDLLTGSTVPPWVPLATDGGLALQVVAQGLFAAHSTSVASTKLKLDA